MIDESKYFCGNEKCPHGFGAYYRDNECVYAGSFVNGTKEGYGWEKTEDGDIYEGYFKDGR